MGRLIDADVFEDHLDDEWIFHKISNKDLKQIRKWLAREKTVDAIPVIRCKDCKYHTGKWCKRHSTEEVDLNDRVTDDYDFCSEAERKEG